MILGGDPSAPPVLNPVGNCMNVGGLVKRCANGYNALLTTSSLTSLQCLHLTIAATGATAGGGVRESQPSLNRLALSFSSISFSFCCSLCLALSLLCLRPSLLSSPGPPCTGSCFLSAGPGTSRCIPLYGYPVQ